MNRPEPNVIKGLGVAIRQHPEILEWLKDWYYKELEALPQAITQPTLMQGRCQVLGELYKFAKESPELAAKL